MYSKITANSSSELSLIELPSVLMACNMYARVPIFVIDVICQDVVNVCHFRYGAK